ncbi:MAG: endopeptidase La [Oscillospiraceae bacterium]|jgi:ATP-dependent Lon protease|nr:endopeptidase La [Oscillospiraceae bacterium]
MPRMKKQAKSDHIVLPVLPLRGMTVFPSMVVHFDVGRDQSIAALEDGFAADQKVFFVTQANQQEMAPTGKDCCDIGTIALVKQVVRMPDQTVRVLAEGIQRAKIESVVQEEPFLKAELSRIGNATAAAEEELIALGRVVRTLLKEFAEECGRISADAVQAMCGIEDLTQLADVIAANAVVGLNERQRILEATDVAERLNALSEILVHEKNIASLEKSLQARIHGQMEKSHRDAYLREQMFAIRKELGDSDTDGVNYREKFAMREKAMPEEAREKTAREISRLQRINPDSPEAYTIENRLEWLLELPWSTYLEPDIAIPDARRVLEEDHDGLMDVKKRLLEFLAVSKLNPKSPIICLVGPPGVGKTSIAQSVARALKRQYVRISLGGVRDEAEIRGHRSTYIGALPGSLINGIRRAKTANPVFLLDEIDKLCASNQGDPAAALLEALDPEQNKAFRDHYLDVPFDLSRVLFIATANTADTIPRPLMDRMEIIEIPSYTNLEKLNIVRNHLLPKQRAAHGLTDKTMRMSDESIMLVIDGYTREAGVRELERHLAALCRKTAVELLENDKRSLTMTDKRITEFLGPVKYAPDVVEKEPLCGVVNGLAYTTVGGSTLTIECAALPGSGKLDLTGSLGDVMQESARAALSFIRANADAYGLDKDFYEKLDLHVHVPEGAVPKDGPSAGVTLTCALVSALTGRSARQDVAMTGEITLRGRVLPIGGVREKVLAAYRSGMKVVLLPEENLKDLTEVPDQARKAMDIRALKTIDDAINWTLSA